MANTQSAQGKPVIPRAREKNGKLQREPHYEVELTERQKARNRAVVMAQPHRRGDSHQNRVWPVGRMILDGGVPDFGNVGKPALLEAARKYAGFSADVKWLLGSGRPLTVATRGERRDPTIEERDAIEKEHGNISRILRDCPVGYRAKQALDQVIIDASPDFPEASFNSWLPRAVGYGLAALVDYWKLRP